MADPSLPSALHADKRSHAPVLSYQACVGLLLQAPLASLTHKQRSQVPGAMASLSASLASAARLLCAFTVAVLLLSCAAPADAQSQSVLQHHKQPTRAGFYTYTGVSGKSIPKTKRIANIATKLTGTVYSQLLYYTKVCRCVKLKTVCRDCISCAAVPYAHLWWSACGAPWLPCGWESGDAMVWTRSGKSNLLISERGCFCCVCSPARATSSLPRPRQTTSRPPPPPPASCCTIGCWRRP